MRCKLCFFMMIWSTMAMVAQGPLSPRIANYDIDLTLDVERKQVQADQTLRWKNTGSTPVTELQFHLYYNAFKNSESTFMKEGSIGGGLSDKSIEDCNWAWIEVLSIKDSLGVELIGNANYIQPDDDNAMDQTVLKVPLQTPVAPGEEAVFDMQWHSKIPKIMPRTGYNKDYFFMVQWFPKVGVYETAGMRYAEEDQWNCHQYHASGEYYSDFGNYDVSITLPKEYTVGASGALKEKKENETTNTWRYVIQDVIDFGWTASPQYVETIQQWKGVEIKLLTYPDHEHCAERYLEAVISAMAFMDEFVGPYPYSTLTIVDPPIYGVFTGGMEYPTFISAVSFCFLPEGIRTPETLVVHEFIHQYFMQMVATHEVEEPWMDEGLTTYFEGKIMDAYLGENTSTINYLGVQIGNKQFNRAEFFNSNNRQSAPSSSKSYEFNGGYGAIAYNKASLWLTTLEGVVGDQTMQDIMRTYFEKWKFKHPCGQDFIDVVNEVVAKNHCNAYGENMDWFFEQVHYGTDLCDYAIEGIYNKEQNTSTGYLADFKNCVTQQETKSALECKVVVRRLEGMQLPVEVAIYFENGKSVMVEWDGQEAKKTFAFDSEHKIVKAVIDPDRKITIDKNWINNSYSIEPDKTGLRYYFSKVLIATQRVIESLIVLI